MNVFLDHLSAIIVGTTVVTILVAAQLMTSESTIEQGQYLAARKQTQGFVQVLEADLFNIGYGVAPHTKPVLLANDSTFTFLRKVDTTAVATVRTISYRRRTARHVRLPDGRRIPVYRVDRTDDGVSTGGVADVLTDFEMTPIQRDGTRAPTSDSVVGVRIEMALSYWTDPKRILTDRSLFARTYYSPNLD